MRANWPLSLGFLFAAALFCLPAGAQWMPLSAGQTSTITTVSSEGKVINQEQTQERYFRRSSGSVLIQQMAGDGSNLPKRATLLDNGKSGRSYSLDYETGAAIDKHRPSRLSGGAGPLPPEAAGGLPQETVQGVPCVVVPSYAVGANGKRTLIGRVWLAPQYNYLMVKEDSLHPLPGGGAVRIQRELHEINAGVEPDDALFSVDKASVKRARAIAPPRVPAKTK
jgi:hypothetical protein